MCVLFPFLPLLTKSSLLTFIRAHTHTPMLIYTHTLTDIYTHTYIRTCSHTCTHMHMLTQAHTYTHAHTHTHTYTYTCKHTCILDGCLSWYYFPAVGNREEVDMDEQVSLRQDSECSGYTPRDRRAEPEDGSIFNPLRNLNPNFHSENSSLHFSGSEYGLLLLYSLSSICCPILS